MLKTKKIVILLVVLLVALGLMCGQVNATDTNLIDLGGLLNGGNNSNQVNDTNTQNPSTNEPANVAGGNEATIIQPNTNRTNETADEELPQTGVTEDITVAFFIIVCAVLAIYAYKKIRDYRS